MIDISSFSTQVKNELAHLDIGTDNIIRAELSALLRISGSFLLGKSRFVGFTVDTENAAVGRRVLAFIKQLTNNTIRTELVVKRLRRLHKNNHYIIRALPSAITTQLLDTLGFITDDVFNFGQENPRLTNYGVKEAYLRGAFLGGGSVNRPDSDYHLEFSTSNHALSRQIFSLLKHFNFPVKDTNRKEHFVIYIKESESIITLLRMLGAETTLEKFESARNLKEVRNQINRLVNCETANLSKTINASLRQVKKIKSVLDSPARKTLSPSLLETAIMRIKHPDASLQELAKLLRVGRSGVYHRLRKLEIMADNINSSNH